MNTKTKREELYPVHQYRELDLGIDEHVAPVRRKHTIDDDTEQ